MYEAIAGLNNEDCASTVKPGLYTYPTFSHLLCPFINHKSFFIFVSLS